MGTTRLSRRLAFLAAVAFAPLVATVDAQALHSGTALSARGAASDSADVAETVSRFHAALQAGDSTAAMALLAPDAVILESGGMETREEYRSHHLPGDISFARTAKSVRGPLAVTVHGDAAWTSSTSTTSREVRGATVNSVGAELVVLIRTPAGWQISAIHWSSRTLRPRAD